VSASLDRASGGVTLIAAAPGAGKSASLAAQIATVLAFNPNPSTVLVVCATDADARALRRRIEKRSGVRRAARIPVVPLWDAARRLADQPPRLPLATQRLANSVASAAYESLGWIPEGFSPCWHIAQAQQRPAGRQDEALALYASSLSELGEVDAAGVLARTDRLLPTLAHLFVDDVDRMPPGVMEWIERQAAVGTAVTYTRTGAPAMPAPAHAARTATRQLHFSSPPAEVHAMISALRGPDAPEVFFIASPEVEARFTFRASLLRLPVFAECPSSARHSREWRFMATALEAALTQSDDALGTLLELLTTERSDLRLIRRALVERGVPLSHALRHHEWGELPEEADVALSTLRDGWRQWCTMDFPVDRINGIADWLHATGRFGRPDLWSVITAEMPFDAALQDVLDALTHVPALPASCLSRVGSVEDVSRARVNRAWISVTTNDDRVAREFEAAAQRAVRCSSVVSRAPLDAVADEGAYP
jgi:hypothetical protein